MKVTVYSKPNCMQCNFTKNHLDDLGVEYIVKDITESEANLTEVQEMGFNAVPVIKVVDESGKSEIFKGFQPDKLDAISSGTLL